MSEIILAVLFIVIGLLSFIAACANWEWFFTSHNASFIVRYLGRKGARLFYGILGVALFVVAFILIDNSFRLL